MGAEILYEWQYVGGIVSTKDDTGKNRDYVGLQICITYKDQMNPLKITDVIGLKGHGGSMTSAVTEGRVYYIRHRTSGKYLEAAGDSDGANVSQKTFTGNRTQKWKVLAVDGGYYKLALQEGSGTRVLDVDGASASAGANMRVNNDTSGDGQKFRIKPLQHNTYQILPKCGKDKTALDNDGGKMDDGANVRTAGSENEENTELMWYFEPVDVELGEDLLEDGSIIAIRN